MSVPFWFDCMASDMRLDICFYRNVPFDLFQTRFVLHKTLFSAKVIFYFFRMFFTTTIFFGFVEMYSLARCSGLKTIFTPGNVFSVDKR